MQAAFTYEEAQLLKDDETQQGVLATSVRHLNSLAQIFRSRRQEAGALTLASPEVRPASSPCSMALTCILHSHRHYLLNTYCLS